MSSTVKVTFETGDRSPEAVEAELRAVVEESTGETPHTYRHHGNVVWDDGRPDVDRHRPGSERPSSTVRAIEEGLLGAAGVDPGAVREAIGARYRSVEAFVEAFPTDRREAIRGELDGEG